MTFHLQRLLLVDIEQTCWDDNRAPGDIIEIGVVELDLRAEPMLGRQVRRMIRTAEEISPYCTALTGITPGRNRKEGRPAAEVFASLRAAFSQSTVWAAWGTDNADIEQACAKHGAVMPFGSQFINLGALWTLLSGSDKRVGLSEALSHVGLDFEGTPHRALDDARNTARFVVAVTTRLQLDFRPQGPVGKPIAAVSPDEPRPMARP